MLFKEKLKDFYYNCLDKERLCDPRYVSSRLHDYCGTKYQKERKQLAVILEQVNLFEKIPTSKNLENDVQVWRYEIDMIEMIKPEAADDIIESVAYVFGKSVPLRTGQSIDYFVDMPGEKLNSVSKPKTALITEKAKTPDKNNKKNEIKIIKKKVKEQGKKEITDRLAESEKRRLMLFPTAAKINSYIQKNTPKKYIFCLTGKYKSNLVNTFFCTNEKEVLCIPFSEFIINGAKRTFMESLGQQVDVHITEFVNGDSVNKRTVVAGITPSNVVPGFQVGYQGENIKGGTSVERRFDYPYPATYPDIANAFCKAGKKFILINPIKIREIGLDDSGELDNNTLRIFNEIKQVYNAIWSISKEKVIFFLEIRNPFRQAVINKIVQVFDDKCVKINVPIKI